MMTMEMNEIDDPHSTASSPNKRRVGATADIDTKEDATDEKKAGRQNYDWRDKKDICQRLYVDEHKSVNEVIQHFAELLNVDAAELPCRKSFLRQFQLWGFPSREKESIEDADAAASARIRELWEQNVNQKDIKQIMESEGWNLKTYEFTKLWRKMGLRLRNEHGYKPPDSEGGRKRKRASMAVAATENGQGDESSMLSQPAEEPISAPMNPEEAAARQQRLMEIQQESDLRLQSRKRRRRIRGYGHLPPDAPGTAPRYASETSLDECKAYLNLDNETYVNIRKEYTAICEEMGILKKTECADGIWEESKRRLINENAHLSAIMTELDPELDKKKIALECLAADVTKRMRVTGRAITIADANNILSLNPAESKAVRRAFYEILAADKFESRLVSGEDHWNELRQQWFQTSEKLQAVVAENDPAKMRAVDLLGRDTMKRFREDRNSRGERVVVQQNAEYGPGPGPAWAAKAPRNKRKPAALRAAQAATASMTLSSLASSTDDQSSHSQLGGDVNINTTTSNDNHDDTKDLFISTDLTHAPLTTTDNLDDTTHQDFTTSPTSPSLLASLAQASRNITFDLDPALANAGPFSTDVFSTTPTSPSTISPIPAYFRLAPESQVLGQHPNFWLGRLAAPTIEALHAAALTRSANARVSKVHGLVVNEDGSQVSYLVESQDELQAYLADVGEKATFQVLLEEGYA